MRERNVWGLAAVLLLVGLLLLVGYAHGSVPAKAGAPEQDPRGGDPVRTVNVRPDLTQLDGYQLRQIALPNFAYLYPWLYNYRLQYPVVAFAGQCTGGLLYIDNSSKLDCWSPTNSTAWAISKPLTLLYQRTTGIQSQIDNEFQLDTPYDVALLYGNETTSAGPVTVETVNLTTGAVEIATTPVPMANSIQSDYVGGGLVVTWNQSGTNGGPELTNLSNGTSWRSGLAVGVAPNNVYWVAQLDAFIDVAGNHLAELKLNAARTSISNVGNAWLNRSGVTSVSAVNGVQYRATTGQISVLEATNLGAMEGVAKLTGGVLTPAGAYTFLSSTQPYIQRYAYTSSLLWSLSGTRTVLWDPLTNVTQSAPNLVTRANASGGNQNYEFTDPYTTNLYLSLNTSLTGNATRAPNQFVLATYPVAVHTRAFLLSNTVGYKTGNYQQTLTVNSAQDSAWEAANLSNIFWTYGSNGTSIPAWLQNGSSNTASASVWELSLASIPASGSVVVDEDFAATTALTFGRFAQTGEAPSLTSTYGAFDNGAIVFPQYDNFAGTSLNTHLWTATFASGSAAVSNGLSTTSVQTGHGSRPACGLVANYNNLSGSFDQQAQIGAGGMGYSKQVGLFDSLTAGSSSLCTGNYEVVSQIDLSRTDYQPSNIYGIFSQTASGNNYNVNTVGLTYKISAPYEMGLAQANDGTHNYANTSINATPANSAGQRFGNLAPSQTLYGGIALWSGNGLAVGNITWWRETAEVGTMPSVAGVPLAPTGLSVTTDTASQLGISWTAPPGTVANSTAFNWSGSSCSGKATGTNVATGSSASYTGLAEGTKESFEVAAWNSTGMGVLSSCVAGTTLAPPSAPTGLSAGTPDTSHVPLTWTLPPGTVLNVTVAVGSTCGAPWAVEYTIGPVSSYAVAGLKSSTRYTFAVAASNATGLSSFSACVTATTATPGPSPGPTPGPNPPAPPGALIPDLPSDTLTIVVVIVLVLVAIYAVGWLISPSRPDR